MINKGHQLAFTRANFEDAFWEGVEAYKDNQIDYKGDSLEERLFLRMEKLRNKILSETLEHMPSEPPTEEERDVCAKFTSSVIENMTGEKVHHTGDKK